MKKIIIFGGAGFIGRNVAKYFIKKNISITIFDIKKKISMPGVKFKYIQGSITNEKKVDKALKNIDYIFHFAGEADIYSANKNPLNAVKKNVLGTAIILDKAIKNKIKKIIFASSIYVYSEQGGVYRTTKQSCELLIENYSQNFGLTYVNLRFGSLYGDDANEFNFINQMIISAIKTGRMQRRGDGNEIRSYVNIDDVAKYCYLVLQKKYKNKNIMIFGKESKSIKQVLNIIKNQFKKDIKIIYTGERDFAHYRTSPFTFKKREFEKISILKEIKFEEGIKNLITKIQNDHQKNKNQ